MKISELEMKGGGVMMRREVSVEVVTSRGQTPTPPSHARMTSTLRGYLTLKRMRKKKRRGTDKSLDVFCTSELPRADNGGVCLTAHRHSRSFQDLRHLDLHLHDHHRHVGEHMYGCREGDGWKRGTWPMWWGICMKKVVEDGVKRVNFERRLIMGGVV